MSNISTHKILMIRPSHFGFNSETAESNAFQQSNDQMDPDEVAHAAVREFDHMVHLLRTAGIDIEVIEDTVSPVKPDAIFPNNWISFHDNGMIVTYPMQAPVRRQEVREDLVDRAIHDWGFHDRWALDRQFPDGPFLEGTGSMILDRENRIVYACLSPRTERSVLEEWSKKMNFQPISFLATDAAGQQIYHTNVMMALGDGYAVICLDSIQDQEERSVVIQSLKATGKEIVDISLDQMNRFAGNMLQVVNQEGKPILVLSEQAFQSLDQDQVSRLSAKATLLPVPLWTIERIGGGSARCMMAEVFLPDRISGF